MGTWVVVVAAVVVLAGLAVWRRPDWLGMEGRTLWDWLSLGIVPIAITLATIALSASQREVEQDRADEAQFQGYVDRISDLALTSAPDDPRAVAVGRAQTTAVLQVVDGPRAGRVIAFLDEMGLLGVYEVALEGRDLAGAELKGVVLDGLDLEGAVLAGADLEEASLARSDLEDANLAGADLKGAVLTGATTEGAMLADALLAGADLRGVDLSDVTGLDGEQLAQACLDGGTALPVSVGEVERGCGPVDAPDDGDDDEDDDDDRDDDDDG